MDKKGLCGLKNIGNTCFMNSVLQCLSHTQDLTCNLRTYPNTRSTSSNDQQILQEFAKLIKEMWTADVHSVTPMELKRAVSTKYHMYSGYCQQDAQEFLSFFLDSLDSAIKSRTRNENSLIRDLFVGQLKSTLKCTTCGNTSVTFDPFWDLSVPLPSSSRCKLEACLDLFIREEVLDGDEMPTCSKCKTRRKCTKSFTIQRFPKCLVIHLQRFSATCRNKMTNIVEFPTSDRELNMGSYGANHNSNVHYSLYAISNHMGLCGLKNIGNTCFMNSVLQCLSHTQELTRYLRAYPNSSSTSSSKDQQILHEFAKLIQEMWTANVRSVTPMELKRAFSTKHRMYSGYGQQDAQEFLRFFLDSLHSALKSGFKGETLNIDDHLSDNKKADLTWEWYSRHENSLIRDLFVGQLKSTLKCTTCGNTSVTFDPFWDLSVPLPSSSRCKLEACLDLFIREEVLDGDNMPTCSKCKTRRKCTKSFTIQRFPKYLVIHLKRFSETRWSKLTNIVEFPTSDRGLNMGSYGANLSSNVHYSLYAISNHMGSTSGGHYVALCKHPVSRKWHEFNDNIVSDSLSENYLVSSSAYIIFYERA